MLFIICTAKCSDNYFFCVNMTKMMKFNLVYTYHSAFKVSEIFCQGQRRLEARENLKRDN